MPLSPKAISLSSSSLPREWNAASRTFSADAPAGRGAILAWGQWLLMTAISFS
jgi:hypothetical protein